MQAHDPGAPPSGEALVRLRSAVVTGLDLAVRRGLGDFRGVLGHAWVATVEAIGPGPGDERLVGQRVVGTPIVSCGACERCAGGLAEHCRKRTVMGVQGRDGCFADLFHVPIRNLATISDHVDDDVASFAVLIAGALQVKRRIPPESKAWVTVLGDDPMALLIASAILPQNERVRVVGYDAGRLAVCERLGIRHRLLADVGRHADQDVVIECTGRADGLAAALELIRPRGTLVLKGIEGPRGAGPLLTPQIFNELTVIGSFAGPIAAAVHVLESGTMDVVPFVGARTRLADGDAVLHRAAEGGRGGVLVTP